MPAGHETGASALGIQFGDEVSPLAKAVVQKFEKLLNI